MLKWNGGKCPVDGETIVRVKVNVLDDPIVGAAKWWSNGSKDEKAYNFWHWHEKGLARIVGYEVVT